MLLGLVLCAAQGGQFVIPTDDPARQLRIVGKIDADWVGFLPSAAMDAAVGPFEDGGQLRRSRLGVTGDLEEWLSFRLNADLADAEIRDAYFDLSGFGSGRLRFGHFREPMGLANQTPSHNQVFLERPMSSGLFPSRNLGVDWQQDFGSDRRGSWRIGVFRETDRAGVSRDDGGGQEVALTSRLSWLLDEATNGRGWTHLGVSASWRNPDAGAVSIDADSGTKFGPNPYDTGTFAAEQLQLFGAEFGMVHESTTLLAEAGFVRAGLAGDTALFQGWYVEAAQLLTGESRPYRKGRAAAWRVRPDHPFSPRGGGRGAFEVGVRASGIDLNDGAIAGGSGLSLGLACNWYLTANLRLQSNLMRANLDGSGVVTLLLFRFHLDF